MLSAQNQPNKTVGSVLLSPVKSSQTRPTKQAGIINNFFFEKKERRINVVAWLFWTVLIVVLLYKFMSLHFIFLVTHFFQEFCLFGTSFTEASTL